MLSVSRLCFWFLAWWWDLTSRIRFSLETLENQSINCNYAQWRQVSTMICAWLIDWLSVLVRFVNSRMLSVSRLHFWFLVWWWDLTSRIRFSLETLGDVLWMAPLNTPKKPQQTALTPPIPHLLPQTRPSDWSASPNDNPGFGRRTNQSKFTLQEAVLITKSHVKREKIPAKTTTTYVKVRFRMTKTLSSAHCAQNWICRLKKFSCDERRSRRTKGLTSGMSWLLGWESASNCRSRVIIIFLFSPVTQNGKKISKFKF